MGIYRPRKEIMGRAHWGNWLTTGVAVATGFLLAFGYGLIYCLRWGLPKSMSIGGQIFAGLAVAAGSSCINEILQKVQGA